MGKTILRIEWPGLPRPKSTSSVSEAAVVAEAGIECKFETGHVGVGANGMGVQVGWSCRIGQREARVGQECGMEGGLTQRSKGAERAGVIRSGQCAVSQPGNVSRSPFRPLSVASGGRSWTERSEGSPGAPAWMKRGFKALSQVPRTPPRPRSAAAESRPNPVRPAPRPMILPHPGNPVFTSTGGTASIPIGPIRRE